jgi:enterochelin esterase-like enzyme
MVKRLFVAMVGCAALSFFGTALGQDLAEGAVHARSFTGPITGDTIKYNIYFPRGYNDSETEYPVLYHLHGLDGSPVEGNDLFRDLMPKMIEANIIPPMLVIFPDGLYDAWYADAKDGSKRAETNIIRELIPHVDKTYRTLQSREQRVISGMSMGGFGAVQYAVKFPQLFSACVSFDGAHLNWDVFQSVHEEWEIDFPAMATRIFGDDEQYFLEHAPWTLAEKNIDMVRDKIAFRLVVGPLKDENAKLRDLLRDLEIEVDYVATSSDHLLEELMEADGEGAFKFIARRLGPQGNKTQDWTKEIAGTVGTYDFVGSESKIVVPYTIYLPPGYTKSTARYPVIYHLHGHDCGQYEGNRPLVQALESAVAKGISEPMIVVFPDGHGDARWADSIDGKKPAETNVIRELIPYIDGKYRTLASREHRVIEGMSMGGGGAVAYAVKFPELFSVCVGYDGAIPTWEQVQSRSNSEALYAGDESYFNTFSAWHNLEKNQEAVRDRVAFRMLVGPLKRYNEPFRDALQALNITHDYVQTDCPHNIVCLIEETSEETFAFLKANMGAAPKEDAP